MKALGNILPTNASMAAADAFADRELNKALKEAAAKFKGLEYKEINGDVRYYLNATQWVLIAVCVKNGRGGHAVNKPKWFETREDGDYPIASPI